MRAIPCGMLVPVFALLTGGCILYTNIVEPLSTDFHNTAVGSKRAEVRAHKFKEPVTGYSASAEWDTRSIQEAARSVGMTNICYTEIHTFSVLDEMYRRKTLVIYGD